MKRYRLIAPLCLNLISPVLQAEDLGSALSTHQQQLQRERERLLRQEQEQAPDVVTLGLPAREITLPAYPEDEQPCSKIDVVRLEGEQAQRFQFALENITGADGALGRCLGTQGIQLVLARVQNAVIGRGYTTTRVLAQPQDLSAGILVLTVLPGKVAQVRLADDADRRGNTVTALPISAGDILNLRDIEQGLENLKRVPSAQADIEITPSQQAEAQSGYSDVVVQYRQAFPFRVSASLDDGGSRSTGRHQAGMTLAYDNWWTLNDLFYVSVNRSLGRYGDRGSRGHTVHYSLPMGYWLLSATTSTSRYHQTVAGAFETIVYSGRAETSEVKLARVVQRSASSKTSLSARLMLRKSFNFIDEAPLGAQQRRTTAWEAGIGHRHFLGAAVAEFNLNYRHALDRQGKAPDDEMELPQIVTRYGLWLAESSLNAPFQLGQARWRYSMSARGQWNRHTLPPQDQFSIGGRYTVRGFDGELTLQAERGWLLRNELALSLESGMELYAGLDAGAVAGPMAQYLSGRRLSGAALGVRGSLDKLSYELFAATPLSRPSGLPAASLTGGFNLQWAY